jgi:hypothetical protein
MTPASLVLPSPGSDPALPPERWILDEQQHLLWTIMRRFERQALGQYTGLGAGLDLSGKAAAVRQLSALAPSDAPLEASELRQCMQDLEASAERRPDALSVLVVQGLVLEPLRRVVYARLEQAAGVSARCRGLAGQLQRVSEGVATTVPGLFAARVPAPGRFTCFVEASNEALHGLDALGEGVDRVFGERFQLQFSDVVGEYVADLVPTCTGLGMERRKVLTHLAGALMGL